MAKTGNDGNNNKPLNGTIATRNGVEFQYQNGIWYPTKSKGWTANETIANDLMAKWKSGDYKVWSNEKGGYIKGTPHVGDNFGFGTDKFPKTFGKGAEQTGFTPRETKAGTALVGKTQTGATVTDNKSLGIGSNVVKTPETGYTDKFAKTKEEFAKAQEKLRSIISESEAAKSQEPTYSTYERRGLKDMFGNLGKGAEGGEGAGKFGQYASYLPDVFNLFMGMKGASEKLPEFKVPSAFTDYENRMRELSYQGLTDVEMATARRDLERSYAYDVNAIGQFAGGRPGVALANLGRAASSYQGGLNALNVASAQMQRSNLANYGNVVGTRLGLEQADFNLRYQQAMQNKMAGAQLAADALSNIQGRYDYQKAYGEGSAYSQYQNAMLENLKYQNELLKYQKENPADISAIDIAPTVLPNRPTASFANQYMQIPTYGGYYNK